MKKILSSICFLFILNVYSQSGRLKSVIYDFDGLDIGQTSLPDGDFGNFDMSYHVAEDPIGPNNVIGDRVLQLDLNWASGSGDFGKGITRYLELDPSNDRFNFYFYNPLSNYEDAQIEITIKEDDNATHAFEDTADDRWMKTVNVARAGSWQLIEVPLNTFTDSNPGGNGVFDIGYTGDAGMLLVLTLKFIRAPVTTAPETYYIDMLCLSEGPLPVGSAILEPPEKEPEDYCHLGCLAYRSPADSVPIEVEAMFPPGNKLRYINIFLSCSVTGTTPNVIPGASVQNLINNGYRPMITWEFMHGAYPRLDPVQPKLNDIISGSMDAYIDAFANKIKTYTDTVVIRPMHEFDGDWYPWSLAQNLQDTVEFKTAYRHIVDRFRSLGANNVLWMLSPNVSPKPNANYNWFVHSYPGDNYVDLIGTSIYNHPAAGVPPWRSFRSSLAETYYYARKYFPHKPFLIAETASRERYASEPSDSQTKAEWVCRMDSDLQSYFHETRAIVFFSTLKQHDWRMNSSVSALNAMASCIWQDPYYSDISAGGDDYTESKDFKVFPNPFRDELKIVRADGSMENTKLSVFNLLGVQLEKAEFREAASLSMDLVPGIYILEISWEDKIERVRIVKN